MMVEMDPERAAKFLTGLRDRAAALEPLLGRAVEDAQLASGTHRGLRGVLPAPCAQPRADLSVVRAAGELARLGLFSMAHGTLTFDEQDMMIARDLEEICARYGLSGQPAAKDTAGEGEAA